MLPYTPLHQLLRGRHRRAARDDERQRLRRADRLRRRRRAASAWPRSPTASSSTTARSRRAPTTRSCASCASARCCCAARAATCPASLDLPIARDAARCSALGAEQKNAFCVAKGDARVVEPPHRRHQELRDAAARCSDGVAHFETLFEVAPEVVAHDLHPDYLSTRYALGREDVELVGVQHHHAHLAATLAEHGETRPGRRRDLRRHGLRHRRHGVGRRDPRRRARRTSSAPGASRADPHARRRARDPPSRGGWRCAWLDRHAECRCRRRSRTIAAAALEHGRADGRSTGMSARRSRRARGGCSTPSRRCAACASRSATRARRRSSSRRSPTALPPSRIRSSSSTAAPPVALDPRPAIRAVLGDLAAGVPVATISARFHAGLARGDGRGAASLAAERAELDLAVLSGGVFQNRLLLELTAGRARATPGCACSCPSGCRRTTARSRSGRSPSRRRARRLPEPAAARGVCSRAMDGFALSERWNGWTNLDVMVRGRARRDRGRAAGSARCARSRSRATRTTLTLDNLDELEALLRSRRRADVAGHLRRAHRRCRGEPAARLQRPLAADLRRRQRLGAREGGLRRGAGRDRARRTASRRSSCRRCRRHRRRGARKRGVKDRTRALGTTTPPVRAGPGSGLGRTADPSAGSARRRPARARTTPGSSACRRARRRCRPAASAAETAGASRPTARRA